MSFTYTELQNAVKDFTENEETSFVTNLPVFIRGAEDRIFTLVDFCLLYTSPSPRDRTRSRMPSSA